MLKQAFKFILIKLSHRLNMFNSYGAVCHLLISFTVINSE